jgi:putative ABC transport system permease protein
MRPDPARALTRGKRTALDRLLPMSLMIRLPLRNVFRVRSRSLSTLVGVLFAFVLVLASWAMLASMQNLVYQTFHSIERWDIAAVFDRPEGIQMVDQVQAIPGVKKVEPLIQLPVTVRLVNAASTGGGGSAGTAPKIAQEELLLTAMAPRDTLHRMSLEGNADPTTVLGSGMVVISRPTANKLHAHIGDTLSFATPLGHHTLQVSAISNEFMSAVAYTSLDEAESWVPFHAQVFNGLYLTVDPAQTNAVKSALYHLPGAASVRLKSAVESDWQSLMGLYYAFMGVILIFALVMAFAILFNAMTVNVLEQQREFATMRSIGAGRGRVALLMTTENVLLWLIALIPGLLLGTWAAQQMVSAFQSDAFNLAVSVNVMTYVITAGGILITMVLAALPAIRRVNRLDLAEATKVLT